MGDYSYREIIRLRDVEMRWDSRMVLSDVNLSVNLGDFIVITGPNGGGKTTLLRIILKLLEPTSGTVEYLADGMAVDRLPIGYLPQKNMIDSRFPIDVRQVISSGLLAKRGLSNDERDRLIREAIELVDLNGREHNAIGSLSGGQLQRALLGRALISNPEVIVLDEPLSYVDKRFEKRIYDIIADVAPSATILLVSHEISKIASMAHRHLIVDQTVHECGSKQHWLQYTMCGQCLPST